MKLLFYRWGANNEAILKKNLIKSGYEVTDCAVKCKNYTQDVELAAAMIEQIHREGAEGIISFNYFPIISMVADVTKVKYYSWVYDCPHFTLYAKTANMSCNRIGIFDSDMVCRLRERGISTVFHLPLAADAKYWEGQIQEKLSKPQMTGSQIEGSTGKGSDGLHNNKYSCDVSFVGSLYTDEHNYFDMIFKNADGADEGIYYDKSKVCGIVDDWCFDYGNNDEYLEKIKKSGALKQAETGMGKLGLELGADYDWAPEDITVPAVFEKKVTVMERNTLLHEISRMQGIDFRLYTNSKTDIKTCGTVDYHTQMPLVFNQSRINLNISLRSIHSGIPLRVMDILACGGFVLSNYQSELALMFKEDEEIALFRSKEEALGKLQYYVNHEEERAFMAQNGQKAVRERFGYEKGIRELIG